MFYLIFMMMMTALVLITSSHPITILCFILIQTLMICSFIWLTSSTSWFSFVLFLIFLGGLMILFVYVVSLASNEKFELKSVDFTTTMLMAGTLLMILTFIIFFENLTSITLNTMTMKIMVIFSSSIVLLSSLMMSYLFLTLLVAIKISSKFEGPLRNLI